MIQHPEIDEAEREAIDATRYSPDAHTRKLIMALASLARAAEKRADEQVAHFDTLSRQYLARAEAAEVRVRELEARIQDERTSKKEYDSHGGEDA